MDSWKFLACISTVHSKWRGTRSSLQKTLPNCSNILYQLPKDHWLETLSRRLQCEQKNVVRRGIGSLRQSSTRPNKSALSRVVPQLNSVTYTSYQPGCTGVLIQAVIVALTDMIPGKDHRPVGRTPPMLEFLPGLLFCTATHLSSSTSTHSAYTHDLKPLFPPHDLLLQPRLENSPYSDHPRLRCQYRYPEHAPRTDDAVPVSLTNTSHNYIQHIGLHGSMHSFGVGLAVYIATAPSVHTLVQCNNDTNFRGLSRGRSKCVC